jgi:transcriptional regulator with XRE-family HTH domain
MNYTITQIVNRLRKEREAKRLSQRELGKLAGVPQSHISKIENGTVDLRLSSLIELARVLGLELTLVPKNALPALKSLAKGTSRPPQKSLGPDPAALKELKRIQSEIGGLLETHPAVKEIAQIQRQIRDLTRLPIPETAVEAIQSASKMLKKYQLDTSSVESLRTMLAELQSVRNAFVHSALSEPAFKEVRAAYSLGDDDG